MGAPFVRPSVRAASGAVGKEPVMAATHETHSTSRQSLMGGATLTVPLIELEQLVARADP